MPTFIPALLLPALILPSLKEYYASLRCPPTPLTKNPSPIQSLRYKAHKAYYTYQVTFSTYMLSDTERLILDLFILATALFTAWCLWVVLPWMVRMMFARRQIERIEEEGFGVEVGGKGKGIGNGSEVVVGSMGEGGAGLSLLVTTVFGAAVETGMGSLCTVVRA